MRDSNAARRPVPMADSPARLAQRLQAGPQLRLFAPQQQATDRLAAPSVQTRSRPYLGVAQATASHPLPLLRRTHDHCPNQASAADPEASRRFGGCLGDVTDPDKPVTASQRRWTLTGGARPKNACRGRKNARSSRFHFPKPLDHLLLVRLPARRASPPLKPKKLFS